MPKNPAAHNAIGFRSAYGAVYAARDKRLSGYGNPPSDPEYQRNNPGGGRLPMQKTVVGVDELPEERRPPEDTWILKPAAQRVGQPIELDGEPEPEPES